MCSQHLCLAASVRICVLHIGVEGQTKKLTTVFLFFRIFDKQLCEPSSGIYIINKNINYNYANNYQQSMIKHSYTKVIFENCMNQNPLGRWLTQLRGVR